MGCICATARSSNAAVANNELMDSSNSIMHLMPHPPSSSSSLSKKEVGSFRRQTSAASITVVANGYPVVRRPSTSSDRSSTKKAVTVGAPTRNPTRRVTAMPAVQQQQQPGRLIGTKTEPTSGEWPSWLASVAGEAIKGWVPRCADSYEKLDKVSSSLFLVPCNARNDLFDLK